MEKSVNKLILFLGLLAVSGCTTIAIPSYIKSENPYKKTFYTDFARTLDAVTNALTDTGWVVTEKTDPNFFEQNRSASAADVKQVLIFTDIRQMGMFLGSHYARVNVYLKMLSDDETEVEIRYLSVNSMFLKSFYNYKHNKSVENLFNKIQEHLNS